MGTGVDELRVQLLDWLYTQSGGTTSEFIEIEPFMAEAGIDLGTAFGLISDGEAHGLMRDASAMGSPCAALTVAGAQAVEEQRRLRTDPAQRAAAARTGLLRWLYAQHHAGVDMPVVAGMLNSEHGVFAGDRLTAAEIDRAAGYLADKGLITGPGTDQTAGPGKASLTSSGLDCVENHEGDVTSYLNNQAGRGSNHSYHINTLNAGAVALGGGDAHQQNTADPATIAAFAQALLRQLGSLPMDNDQRTATQAATEELRAELDQPNPEHGRIKNLLDQVVGYLADAGKPVLTALLLAWAQRHGGTPD